MRNLRRMCGATVLTCVLAVSVFAGHMSAPGVAPPPPPPPTNAQGEIQYGLLALLQAVLGVL